MRTRALSRSESGGGSPLVLFERLPRVFLLFSLGYVSFVLLPFVHTHSARSWVALGALPLLPLLWLGEERRKSNAVLWDIAESAVILVMGIAGPDPQALQLLIYLRVSLRT